VAPPISTRYAILLDLLRSGPQRPKDLVGATELTLQGVAYQLKQLEAEGLVSSDADGRRLRLTPAGVDALHRHFLGLKAFVDLALTELMPVERCVALAAEDLGAGATVGLFMEEGRLVARMRVSPSEGRTASAANEGDLVIVRELTGVVDLQPATVHVVRLPAADRLPPAGKLASFVHRHVGHVQLLVTAGLEAERLVLAAELSPESVVRFAPAAVARHAAQLGVTVLVVASSETFDEVHRELSEPPTPTQGALEIRVHDLPER